jgi:hypothetical protein
MTLTAAGRDIFIDDRMEKWYGELGQGPVSEIFILDELETLFHKDPIELCHTLPDEELTDCIHGSILDYLCATLSGYGIQVKDRCIHIPECLVRDYEKMGVGKVDGLYVLSVLGTIYGQDLDSRWQDIEDREITKTISRALAEEILF